MEKNQPSIKAKRMTSYQRKLKNIQEKMDYNVKKRMIASGMFLLSGFIQGFLPPSILLMGVFFGAFTWFLFLIYRHQKYRGLEKIYRSYYKTYKKEFDRQNEDWRNFKEEGQEYFDESHPYTQDLDVFGRASLFQWLNTTASIFGKEALKKLLEHPLEDEKEIISRQEALEELGKRASWGRKLIIRGSMNRERKSNAREEEGFIALKEWILMEEEAYRFKSATPFFLLFMSVGTLLSVILMIFTPIPLYLLGVIPGIHLWVYLRNHSRRARILGVVKGYERLLSAYKEQFILIEKGNFQASELKAFESSLNKSNQRPSSSLRRLEKITQRIANRNNLFFIPFNFLLLWDHHCLFQLREWKKGTKEEFFAWFEVLGIMEGLVSLSTVYRDYSHWTLPKITKEKKSLFAKRLNHPLIGQDGVANDFRLDQGKPIALITGSNMSGKSTLLRAVGMNLLLMQLGLKVRADDFSAPIMKIYTCMRVSDNLEKKISSFYGEILRIKAIVEETDKGTPVFFLLDEIFKGTNSKDRHLGAKILIRQLYKKGGMGMVSTHDLELVEIGENELYGVINYYFQESYINEQIFFDYKLRKGFAKTTNALYLMKMAGVEIEQGKEIYQKEESHAK